MCHIWINRWHDHYLFNCIHWSVVLIIKICFVHTKQVFACLLFCCSGLSVNFLLLFLWLTATVWQYQMKMKLLAMKALWLLEYLQYCHWKGLTVLSGLTYTERSQLLRDLLGSVWQRPQTRCPSGPCLPPQQEQRGSRKRSGCVRRPSQLPSWVSTPRFFPQTPSLRCWQTHYVATCGSPSCGWLLNQRQEEERWPKWLMLQVLVYNIHLIYCVNEADTNLEQQSIVNHVIIQKNVNSKCGSRSQERLITRYEHITSLAVVE